MAVKNSSSSLSEGAVATGHLITLAAIEFDKGAQNLSVFSPLARMGRPLTSDTQALTQSPALPNSVCGLGNIRNAQSIAVRTFPRHDRAIFHPTHHRRLLSRLNARNVPSNSCEISRLPPTRQRQLSPAHSEGLSTPPAMLMPHHDAPPHMGFFRDCDKYSTVGSHNRGDDVQLQSLFLVPFE